MYTKGNPIRMKDPTGHEGESSAPAKQSTTKNSGNGGGFCNSKSCRGEGTNTGNDTQNNDVAKKLQGAKDSHSTRGGNNIIKTGNREISDAGVNFIARKEGTHIENDKHTIYKDAAGKETIGYGHLLTDGEKSKYKDGLTEKEAKALLKSDIKKFSDVVNSELKVDANQNEFDAMVSLAFNIGGNAFKKSSALKKINNSENKNKNTESIESSWKAWNKITDSKGKRVSPGLSNRRNAEWDLFSKGKY